MGWIEERCTEISGACRCVGGAAQKTEISMLQVAGAGVECVRNEMPKDSGSPSREGKFIAMTGSDAG